MVKRTVFPTLSKKSQRRVKKASVLSQMFRQGDRDAWFRLSRRHRGFLSLSVGMPWDERLRRAREALRLKRLKQKSQESLAPYLESSRDV